MDRTVCYGAALPWIELFVIGLLSHGSSVIMSASQLMSGLCMVKYRKLRTAGVLGGSIFVARKSHDHHYDHSVVTKYGLRQSAVDVKGRE